MLAEADGVRRTQGVVVVHRSRPRRSEGRCRGDLRCARAGDPRDVAPLDRLRARLRRPRRSRSGASSRRSCRCCSRSADFGSSIASATGRVDRSPGLSRSSSASASPPHPRRAHGLAHGSEVSVRGVALLMSADRGYNPRRPCRCRSAQHATCSVRSRCSDLPLFVRGGTVSAKPTSPEDALWPCWCACPLMPMCGRP